MSPAAITAQPATCAALAPSSATSERARGKVAVEIPRSATDFEAGRKPTRRSRCTSGSLPKFNDSSATPFSMSRLLPGPLSSQARRQGALWVCTTLPKSAGSEVTWQSITLIGWFDGHFNKCTAYQKYASKGTGRQGIALKPRNCQQKGHMPCRPMPFAA